MAVVSPGAKVTVPETAVKSAPSTAAPNDSVSNSTVTVLSETSDKVTTKIASPWFSVT